MASSTFAKQRKSKSTQSSSLKNAILIIPLIGLVAFCWFFLMYLDMLPSSLTFNLEIDTWLNLFIVIFVILIVVLICIPQSGGTVEAKVVEAKTRSTTKGKAKDKKEVSMVTIEPDDKPIEFLPVGKAKAGSAGADKKEQKTAIAEDDAGSDKEKKEIREAETTATPAFSDKTKQKMIKYPSEVEGGIYSDTFININDETVLKLRTLTVKDIYLL